MRKLTAFSLMLSGFFFTNTYAQGIQRHSITASKMDQKGVASATAYLDYTVRRFEGQIYVTVSYSRIVINADAGVWYKGRLYKNEVPGLINLLQNVNGSNPTVNFNIFYNNISQESRSFFITERNNLSLLGDNIILNVSADKLNNPAGFRVEAQELVSFSTADWWYKAESLIQSYEREQKERSDYLNLIREADDDFNQKNYAEALKNYYTASRSQQADAYPARMIERAKEAMKKDKDATQFDKLMKNGDQAERSKDYAEAIRQFDAASEMGVNDAMASNNASRVRRIVDQLKRDDEDRLRREKEESDRRNKAAADKLISDKLEEERLLKQKEEELKVQKDKEQEEEANKLKEDEKRQFDEQLKKQADEREKKRNEENEKEKAERTGRRSEDESIINRYKNSMRWDPVQYEKLRAEADSIFDKGMYMDPGSALQLKEAWWDQNLFMKDFREDLNEPRRQDAWENYQALLRQQEMQFAIAKSIYMEAVKYTDPESEQYRYLIGKVEQMNQALDIQKSHIKLSGEMEQMRRQNFLDARAWAAINRRTDNRLKAQLSYQYLTQQYLYPNHNYEGPNAENALQRQIDYENRLNAADQQLKQDNLITGVTTQITTSVLMDDSKVARVYGNGMMGLNLFAFSGGANYPVVSNTEDNPDYVMSSSTSNLSVMPFTGGFDWWIRRSRIWDLGITGDLTFGVMPLLGHNHILFNYGGNAKLNVGYKAIKLALEADIHKRYGSYHYDQDVATSENQYATITGLVWSGEFNYSVLRFGGGVHIQYGNEYGDGYMRLLMYAEKPSFYQNFSFKKPVLSFGFQVMFRGGFTFNGAYAQNYPVGGTAKYMMLYYSNRDMWTVSLGKIWTIAQSK